MLEKDRYAVDKTGERQQASSRILKEIIQILQSRNPTVMDDQSSQEFQNQSLVINRLDSYERSLRLLEEQASLYTSPDQVPVQLKQDLTALSSEVERLRTLANK